MIRWRPCGTPLAFYEGPLLGAGGDIMRPDSKQTEARWWRVIGIAEDHPSWGYRKVAALARMEGEGRCSDSTAYRILRDRFDE